MILILNNLIFTVLYLILWITISIVNYFLLLIRCHKRVVNLKNQSESFVSNNDIVSIETEVSKIKGSQEDEISLKNMLFYNNPDDDRAFVEKRIGIGVTVNMANREGRRFIYSFLIFIAGIILFFVLSMILVTVLSSQ